MIRRSALITLALLVVAALAGHTALAQMAARDVVLPTAFASFDPVAKGKRLQIAVVMKIHEGYHVNARKPTFDYLIPTDLKFEMPAGFKAGEVQYPDGQMRKFSFSKNDALNVYEGNTVLRIPVTVSENAPTGAQTVPLKLRYQACSNEVCLPPVTLNLTATINVSSSPSAAKPAHPELFPR